MNGYPDTQPYHGVTSWDDGDRSEKDIETSSEVPNVLIKPGPGGNRVTDTYGQWDETYESKGVRRGSAEQQNMNKRSYSDQDITNAPIHSTNESTNFVRVKSIPQPMPAGVTGGVSRFHHPPDGTPAQGSNADKGSKRNEQYQE